MDHEAIQGLIPAYALDATDEPESRLVAAHLPSCPGCQALLAGYRRLSDDLLFAAPVQAAPAGLGERLRARVAAAPPARAASGWSRWLAAFRPAPSWVAVAAAVLVLAATNVYWFGRVGRLEREASQQAAALESLTRRPGVSLYGAAPEMAGHGVMFASEAGDLALLCVYDMPVLSQDRAYQVWLLKDGTRESAGVFGVDPEGYGLLMVKPSRPVGEYDALGITVEPAGGSPGPTTPRILGTEL